MGGGCEPVLASAGMGVSGFVVAGCGVIDAFRRSVGAGVRPGGRFACLW